MNSYNARTEDITKIFFSDQIYEQGGKIIYRNGQIFCTIRDRITSKKKEVRLSVAIIFGALFVMLTEAKAIGVPTRLSSAPEINRPAPQYFYQHAQTVNPRVDKIIMITNNKMIPLIYINGFGPSPSSSFTQLAVIPTKAQYVMTKQEALKLIAKTYSNQMEVTANEIITDWQAAKHLYDDTLK